MNRFNPNKLYHSKWTAITPLQREKHFIVCEVTFTEQGSVEHCVLEAVYSGRQFDIDWRVLKNASQWQQGWK
ncbi:MULTISPECIES: TIGR02450 family Trp-rich protein [unclassified Vibrio]|uniref:TIGR02450 family Trp-rich protein n=1 Tax=Vibrio sp. HB236076 TaxID=3232307 RepID=A0AB39HBI1_9VIBR|nr:TIGR02450 family Trp-rich protein [Vibrio sp. HB161653]MDP5253460.1 TIGR02450 family Trp-rich protein [Vibrio sp. HB161653]